MYLDNYKVYLKNSSAHPDVCPIYTHALCAYGFNLVVISVNNNNYKRNKLDV